MIAMKKEKNKKKKKEKLEKPTDSIAKVKMEIGEPGNDAK
jgi:hypothetical protein